MKNLKAKYGNKALVTGGSSGIGRAFAVELAKQGIEPILVARNQERLKATASEISRKYKVNVSTYSVDLSDEVATQAFLSNLNDLEIGLFIHSAGMENNGSFTKISTEQELKLIKLNVNSTYLLTKFFAKKMEQNKKGGILLVSSMGGLMPMPYFTNYAATKSYVHYFGVALRNELKDKGVDLSVLAPGLTETNMVADNGVDWSKLPFVSQEPSTVAQIALNNLGKKATIIPGFMNKMMVAMSRRTMTLKAISFMNGFMIRKAISKTKM